MAVIFNLNQSIPFPLRENYFHVALCPHIKETKGAIPAFAIFFGQIFFHKKINLVVYP